MTIRPRVAAIESRNERIEGEGDRHRADEERSGDATIVDGRRPRARTVSPADSIQAARH